MKKRLLSAMSAAAVLISSVPWISAAETASLSSRASVAVVNGYIKGITGVPDADFIASQYDGEISIISPDGDELTGSATVPTDSTVRSGSNELAKVLVPGDVNRDGQVNLGDITGMLKDIAKWDIDTNKTAGDVDKSGNVDLADVTHTLKYIAKWDVSLGGEYLIDLSNGYKLLAKDIELDQKIVQRVKEATGVELKIVSENVPGESIIAVGRNLHLSEGYEFIDGDDVAALPAEPENPNDALYIDTYGGDVYLTVNDKGELETAVQFIADSFAGTAADIYRGYCGPVSGMTESGVKYQRAVRNIQRSEAVTDGTNGMNGDILAAITNAEYTEPKNFIYMIGDGMGKNIVTAAEICHKDDLYGGTMTMNYLPNEGLQSTYSSDQQITDSAAGGTALATGYKTTNGTISQSPADENGESVEHKTLLELAAEKGKSTGIIATKSVTDATPASFTAHVDGRSEETAIAGQQIAKLADGTLDLILGGGYSFYDNASNAEALAAAINSGVTYTKDWTSASGSALPLAGLFTSHEMSTNPGTGEPHIAAMTDLALDLLSEDEDGFFLMVEGSKIDTFGHNNDFGTQVDETFEFDCAVAVALRYVALNPDTVLIITADHETGELAIPANPTADNIRTSSRYSSGGHHWVDVPVYAVGYRTEELVRLQENTDVAIFIADLMGEEKFGADSSDVYTLFDLTDKAVIDAILAENENSDAVSVTDGGLRVSFSNSFKTLFLPVEKIASDPANTQNVSAIRVTYTNASTTAKIVPICAIKCDGGSYTSGERITYVEPGETFEYTYVLDSNIKNDGRFNSSYELALSLRGSNADYVISGITVINRSFGE